jgi:hypothetical protein
VAQIYRFKINVRNGAANIGHSVNRWRMASQPNDIAANDMADPPLF